MPASRVLPVLLALMIRQHGEQTERSLSRGQHDPVILKVVTLASSRRDELHFPRIRYLHHFTAIFEERKGKITYWMHLTRSLPVLTLQHQTLGTAVGHLMSELVIIDAEIGRLAAGSCAY